MKISIEWDEEYLEMAEIGRTDNRFLGIQVSVDVHARFLH